jgi:hypothetical protein
MGLQRILSPTLRRVSKASKLAIDYWYFSSKGIVLRLNPVVSNKLKLFIAFILELLVIATQRTLSRFQNMQQESLLNRGACFAGT